jgi:uncharacterized protein YutE (UPF0331/DUF86 family)
LAPAAGLRDRLVHEYESLDPVKVFVALGDARRDIPHYVEQVNGRGALGNAEGRP